LLDGNGGGTPKQAELVSAQGYEAFGSLLPGRNYSSGSYRFGFNGKENDNEWHGATGTLQDYGMRAYDTRVARFFAVDPIAYQYPMLTPYQFASNMPIAAIDLDGLEAYVVVFPDYKIATPLGKLGGLGHAGSLIVDPSTGDAYYVEYGRYDKEGKGIARTIGGSHNVGSVSFGNDGLPTESSLANVLGVISTLAGHGGRIEAAEVPVTQDEFSRAKEMHQQKLEDNSNPNRAPYKLKENNCGTFSCDVVKDSKADSNIPDKYSPKPSKMIRQVLAAGATRVGYDPKTRKAQRGGEYIPSKDEKETESLIGE
jgi:RHS repeat-associated protein